MYAMNKELEWVFGVHAILNLLEKRPEQISRLLIAVSRSERFRLKIEELALAQGVAFERVEVRQLDQLVSGVHQGVAALCASGFGLMSEKELYHSVQNAPGLPLLLVLDGVTDPHNLGACLRTADAAGVDAVIVPKNKSAPMNATVRKVACGAAEVVPVVAVTNLVRCLQTLQSAGVWIVGADGEAQETFFSENLTGALAVVMGSEGSGLRRLTRESCDYLLSIPMSGELSSLNVSVATGVALFEVVRQRNSPKVSSH
jgi:23S rRNA (guanosine2251-2'-O)-methyltransferase